MNLIKALKTGKPLRRPIAKHWGSHKNGWLDNEYVRAMLCPGRSLTYEGYPQTSCTIDIYDALSEDWEVRISSPEEKANEIYSLAARYFDLRTHTPNEVEEFIKRVIPILERATEEK